MDSTCIGTKGQRGASEEGHVSVGSNHPSTCTAARLVLGHEDPTTNQAGNVLALKELMGRNRQ